jgi:hypothetical protein
MLQILRRLLVWLTVPVGVLVNVETSNPNPTPKFIVYELTQFLNNAKESFLDNPIAIRVLFDHLSCLLANVRDDNSFLIIKKPLRFSLYKKFFDVAAAAVNIRLRVCEPRASPDSQHSSRSRKTFGNVARNGSVSPARLQQ